MTLGKLGSYELLEELGRGGMGVVYRARQPSLNRGVALKVLPAHLAKDTVFVERFLREARAAAHLEHPGIVTIYDVGESDDIYYFAMQLLPGESLAELLAERERLDTKQVASLGIQVADALAYAHSEGILHRDIKPGNLLIDRNGRCILTDFGIALAQTDTRLTQTGASLGSPHYMAPEILNGKPPDGRSDLYSLGVVLFEVLTGQTPYQGDSAIAVAYQHVAEHLPRVRELLPDASEPMDRVIARLMAKDPDERYPTASELVADLLEVSGGVIAALPSASGQGGVLSPTPVTPTETVPAAAPPTPAPGAADSSTEKRKGRTGRTALVAVGAAVALAAGIYLATTRPWEGSAAIGPPATTAPPPGEAEAPPPESDPGAEDPVSPGDSEPGADPGADPGAAASNASTDSTDSTDSTEPGPEVAPPVEPVVERFSITSRPSGAAVYLAGERVDGATPVEVAFTPGRAYPLRVELADHEPAGMEVDLDELPEAVRASGELHFPLTPSTPPGFLTAAAAYPATLRVDGREVAAGQRLRLAPGSYRVEISAPTVFYEAEQTVEIVSEETRELRLPPAVEVTVAAAPSHCRVKIDGREVDFVPFTVELAVGTHRFEFNWENLQTSRVVEQEVTGETRRVFAAADEGEG